MAYENTIKLAWENVLTRAPAGMARFAGGIYREAERLLLLPVLNEDYVVDLEGKKISRRGEAANAYLSVLILHYLSGVKETPLSGEWVSFKEIESGQFYFPAFYQRAIKPLLENFSARPEALFAAGEKVGGEKVSLGEIGLKVSLFPKLPTAIVWWKGDREFPPNVNILFDRTANEFLLTEDLAVAAGMITGRLINASKR